MSAGDWSDFITDLPSLPLAACAEVGGDEWFPEAGTHTGSAVRAICAGCPERVPCLEYALSSYPLGIWAGTSEAERRVLRRRRRGAA